MAGDAKGETVLHLAASSWYPDMMSWLVESGADVNWAGGKQDETPSSLSLSSFSIVLYLTVDYHNYVSDKTH